MITGWVRGAGSEQFFNNANPAYNREMFNEAHDFIIQAWTRPGPWRYEGKHFHYRHVNPWALPYQKPHPPMWIPGMISAETVKWCAEHRYPYIGLGTQLGPTCDLWDYYADEAAKLGYEAGPENFGYLVPTFVAETEEKAQEMANNFSSVAGKTRSRARVYDAAGIQLEEAIRMLAKQTTGSWLGVSGDKMRGRRRAGGRCRCDPAETDSRVSKSAETIPGNRRHAENGIAEDQVDPAGAAAGVFIIFSVQGPVPNKDRRRACGCSRRK